MTRHVAVVGAGFSGAVLARQLAESCRFRVTVVEEREHVAGNCHTSRDQATGIMLHHYGPHIFHTDRPEVWEYVNRFARFHPFTNRVKAVTRRGVFSLPINLLTINQFFNLTMTPDRAREFLERVGNKSIKDPQTFEAQALRFLGRELYENFFYGYTKKQWGVEPSQLPASILKRLPVRFNYDDNYYASPFQGIPEEGYTALVEKILDHPAVTVRLSEKFYPADRREFDHVFWTGPLDAFFGYELGRLQYRSLSFERIDAQGDFQGNPVVNYCEESVPFTRIAEHKHFTPWEIHDATVCFRERSHAAGPDDTPYYPLRLAGDKALLGAYVSRADQESGVTFLGRLGTYRYLDMHVVIREALELSQKCLTDDRWPTFSASPL